MSSLSVCCDAVYSCDPSAIGDKPCGWSSTEGGAMEEVEDVDVVVVVLLGVKLKELADIEPSPALRIVSSAAIRNCTIRAVLTSVPMMLLSMRWVDGSCSK